MSLHAGILAHSMEGALLCARTFAHEGFQLLGPHTHPDLTLDCIAMGQSMAAWDEGDLGHVRNVLATSVQNLARAGADFFVCPDNTAHMALEAPGPELPIPGLHIAQVVAERAAVAGYERVGILGTAYLMGSEIYPRELDRAGVAAVRPDDAQRAYVHAAIFDELVNGVFRDDTKREFQGIVAGLAEEEGCDAVAMVCTEIPLLLDGVQLRVPALDSTRLLGRAALMAAVGDRPAPTWRGGPLTT